MSGLVVHVGHGEKRFRAAVNVDSGLADVSGPGVNLTGTWHNGLLMVEGLEESVREALSGELAQGMSELMGLFYSHAA